MTKEYSPEVPLASKKLMRNDRYWFIDLLDNIDLSTTQYIMGKIPSAKFVLLEQNVTNLHIFRKIVFSIDNHVICEAINKIERNYLIDKWIKENHKEPFGKFFQNKNLHRVLVSKSKDERKYLVIGIINAEIEERFYPLPKGK